MDKKMENIVQRADTRRRPGAKPEQISAFEHRANLKLPDAYKEWLVMSDGGEIFCPEGPELLGVANENSRLLIRSGDDKEAPKTMVVIGRTSSGDALCYKAGTERIVQWSHSLYEEFLNWEDFHAYLKQAEEIYGDEE